MVKTGTVIIAAVVAAGTLVGQTDPGPRKGPPMPATPIRGLTTGELALFQKGLAAFQEDDQVPNGLGPRFNLDSCGGCHSHPASLSLRPLWEIASQGEVICLCSATSC